MCDMKCNEHYVLSFTNNCGKSKVHMSKVIKSNMTRVF